MVSGAMPSLGGAICATMGPENAESKIVSNRATMILNAELS